MQNLPKIKTKKIIPFKSPFLESFLNSTNNNSKTLHSENKDPTILKPNSYDVSLTANGYGPSESKRMGLIKKGFKKIFDIDPKKDNNNSLMIEKRTKDNKFIKKNSYSLWESKNFDKTDRSQQEVALHNEISKILPFDFKKMLGKQIKERKLKLNSVGTGMIPIRSHAAFYDSVKVKLETDSSKLIKK